MTSAQIELISKLVSECLKNEDKEENRNIILLKRVDALLRDRAAMLGSKNVNSVFDYVERQQIRRAFWICSVSAVGEHVVSPNPDEFSW